MVHFTLDVLFHIFKQVKYLPNLQLTSSINFPGAADTETITIKQENGILLQYELPVEHEPTWQRTLLRSGEKAIRTKAPEPKKRGRPRKYPDDQGQIGIAY